MVLHHVVWEILPLVITHFKSLNYWLLKDNGFNLVKLYEIDFVFNINTVNNTIKSFALDPSHYILNVIYFILSYLRVDETSINNNFF